jgi:hypothetical protein
VADEARLKLGKGEAFVKGRLRRLTQSDETWETDFQNPPAKSIQPGSASNRRGADGTCR